MFHVKHWISKPDPLILAIITAVLLAIVVPVRGYAADVFHNLTIAGVALLFFLYGARLSTREAMDGLKNWKLHATILAFTYLLFPIVGLALYPLHHLIGMPLYIGVLYLCLVPSTVQSSVAFTSIARGNVAGAIVSASVSNVAGVALTPLLVMGLMSRYVTAPGNSSLINAQVFVDIACQLLLPFVLGQIARKISSIKRIAQTSATKLVDRGSIAMVVYSAFSAGVVGGVWSAVSPFHVVLLIALSITMVAFMLVLTAFLGNRLGFNYKDTIAIQFCGSKKSLATGLPMAAVIFGSAQVGTLILPLMIFHQVQLMMCSWLAARYAKQT